MTLTERARCLLGKHDWRIVGQREIKLSSARLNSSIELTLNIQRCTQCQKRR